MESVSALYVHCRPGSTFSGKQDKVQDGRVAGSASAVPRIGFGWTKPQSVPQKAYVGPTAPSDAQALMESGPVSLPIGASTRRARLQRPISRCPSRHSYRASSGSKVLKNSKSRAFLSVLIHEIQRHDALGIHAESRACLSGLIHQSKFLCNGHSRHRSRRLTGCGRVALDQDAWQRSSDDSTS